MTTSALKSWAQKHSGKGRPANMKDVEFIYPKSASKTDGKTRFTMESTAVASGLMSKYDKAEKGSIFEELKVLKRIGS